ncbi:hypothetical protein DVH05_009153 [Phytophthora capsici]|nr:hypothetical protein DVH05_009153 [Phytophthora capsici]
MPAARNVAESLTKDATLLPLPKSTPPAPMIIVIPTIVLTAARTSIGMQANSLRDTGGGDTEDLEPESSRAASMSEDEAESGIA